jgi:riboflavin kinase/FMN adenylyltransferase
VLLIRQLHDFPDALGGGAVAIGNFDGVHLGHARLIETLVAEARRLAGPAIAFTFDPHPARILRPDRTPPSLSWIERKAELLGELGVDAVIAYPTDAAMLGLDARTFFERIILARLAARAVVEGVNFFFGHGRSGDIAVLGELCDETGIVLKVAEPVVVDGEIVSSSRLRRLVTEGRVHEARRMLTQPYRVRGTVARGVGRGATLGFPTANVHEIDTLLPAEGVYAGRAWVDGACWPAATHLGPNRTFDEHESHLETHLLGYEGDLCGRRIEVDFLERLRQTERFDRVERLVAQMHRDVADTRRIVAEFSRFRDSEPRGEPTPKEPHVE